MANLFQSLVYQEPSSIYLTAVTVMTILFLSFLVISEITGNNLKYSKFWNTNSSAAKSQPFKLSSRTGMLILYTPAALVSLASFVIFPDGGIRFLMLKSAVSIHFSKRVLEVIIDWAWILTSFYVFILVNLNISGELNEYIFWEALNFGFISFLVQRFAFVCSFKIELFAIVRLIIKAPNLNLFR